MKNNSTYSDFLKQENELTRLKLQAEFGFKMDSENDLNPAIENIWLKQILDFERSMVSNKKITIREKLGNPTFKPFAEIPEKDISNELQIVMEHLHKKNIVVDSVAGADDTQMYRFITEELLDQETDSNVPANMLVCFIYEEFHQNHDYDIRERSKELINALETSDTVDFSFFISREGDDEIHEIRYEQLKRKFEFFKDAFDEIKVKTFTIKNIDINNESAEVNFYYKLSLLPVESRTRHNISGEGKFFLNNRFDWWTIYDVVMEGVV
jgi:hypothetical protein